MNLYFDLETGGLISSKHGIIAIGWVLETAAHTVIGSGLIEMNPYEYAEVDPTAFQYNHYDKKQCKTFQHPELALAQFVREVRTLTKGTRVNLIGYNSDAFDIPMLKRLFAKYDRASWNKLFTYKSIDIFKTVLWLYDNQLLKATDSHKLVDVCRGYGIDLDAHDALRDTLATRELSMKLVGSIRNG